MSHLFKHSTVGSIIRFFVKGNLSFSRRDINVKSIDDEPSTLFDADGNEKHLVDWDGDTDPDNPQNWPFAQKLWVTTILSFYTVAVYIGSSIYSSSEADVIEVFGVTQVEGSLGLALYVLGYGLGCLLFSPLSELPAVGRNPPYAISGFLFIILCIPTALVNNYPGLMVLRFLLGFMASPCLATAGASLGDIWSPAAMPFAIAVWASVATMGPALGPTVSSFAVKQLGWRFSSWELLIISGPIYALLVCSLPETSGLTILYYRARQLRDETGNMELMSTAEKKQKELSAGSLLFDALVKPWEMNIKDPALLFTTFYMGLIYGIFYSFFESLPLVYPVYYSFSATSTGLIFLSATPACLLALTIHWVYLKKQVFPKMNAGTFGELENFLVEGIAASVFIPIGLFIYAWCSRPSIHWMVPTVGLGIMIFGIFFVAQAIFMYIPSIYPRYAASIFAANSLSRSLFAFAAILFSTPMFKGIGIGGGVSLLGGFTVLCVLGMILLYKFGKTLRERSSFTSA